MGEMLCPECKKSGSGYMKRIRLELAVEDAIDWIKHHKFERDREWMSKRALVKYLKEAVENYEYPHST